jgi:hypothetical protein
MIVVMVMARREIHGLRVQDAATPHLHDDVVALGTLQDLVLSKALEHNLFDIVPLVLVHLGEGKERVGLALEKRNTHLHQMLCTELVGPHCCLSPKLYSLREWLKCVWESVPRK